MAHPTLTLRRSRRRRVAVPLPRAEAGWLQRRPTWFLVLAVTIAGSTVVGASAPRRPSMAVALAISVAGGVAVLRRPSLGAYALVGLVPITSGLRRGFPIPNLRLSEAMVFGIGLTVLAAADRTLLPRWRSVDWLLFAWASSWLAMGLLNISLLHQQLTLSSFEVMAGPFQFVLLYRAVVVGLPGPVQRRCALAILLWSSVPVSVLALLQQVRFGPVQRLIANITGGDVFNSYAYHFFARATGPFNHWTPLAGYLFIILMVGAVLLLEDRSPMARSRLAAILLLAAVGLVLSAELSAISCAVVGGLILGARYGRLANMGRWMFLGAAIIAVTFGSYLGSRLDTQFYRATGDSRSSLVPQTIQYRTEVWTQQYFPAIAERPLTGWGPDLPSRITWTFTESQYVTLLMEGGIVVLGTYGGLMWALYRRGADLGRGRGTDRTGRALGRCLAVCVLLLIPMNAIFPYFSSGGLAEPFWVLAGLTGASLGLSAEADASAEETGSATGEPVAA